MRDSYAQKSKKHDDTKLLSSPGFSSVALCALSLVLRVKRRRGREEMDGQTWRREIEREGGMKEVWKMIKEDEQG